MDIKTTFAIVIIGTVLNLPVYYTALETTVPTSEDFPVPVYNPKVVPLNKSVENAMLNINGVNLTVISEDQGEHSTIVHINKENAYGSQTINISLSNNSTPSFTMIPPSNSTDTEVADLQIVPTLRPVTNNNLPIIPLDDDQDVDTSIELIDDGENTEDEMRQLKQSGHHEPGVALVQGRMAAILAGVFMGVSIIGYIGLLSYRRYLENRYGNREMLVNEFEFEERDDRKYFSI